MKPKKTHLSENWVPLVSLSETDGWLPEIGYCPTGESDYKWCVQFGGSGRYFCAAKEAVCYALDRGWVRTGPFAKRLSDALEEWEHSRAQGPDASNANLIPTNSEPLSKEEKLFKELSTRGKRLYNELFRLYPDLPITTKIIDGGAVVYTSLKNYDFEIYGGFYGRTIKCCIWRLFNHFPGYTMETIEIPSKDAAFAAHKIREIVEKYRNMENELDEEAAADGV